MLNHRRRENDKNTTPERAPDVNRSGWESALQNPYSLPIKRQSDSRAAREEIDLARLLSVFEGVSEISDTLEPFVHELLHLDRDAIAGLRKLIEERTDTRPYHNSPARGLGVGVWRLAQELVQPTSRFLGRFVKGRQGPLESPQPVPSQDDELYRKILLACHVYFAIYDRMNPNWIEESTTFFFYPDPASNQFREGGEVHTWPTLNLFGEPQYLTDHQKNFLIQKSGSHEVIDLYAKKADFMKNELLRVMRGILFSDIPKS